MEIVFVQPEHLRIRRADTNFYKLRTNQQSAILLVLVVSSYCGSPLRASGGSTSYEENSVEQGG